MVRFEQVTSGFRGARRPVLKEISFHIEPGNICLLTGESGCGKTTLLRLLLRDLAPTEGTIRVNGRDIGRLGKREIPFFRRKIGVVFAGGRLLDDRTVYENVALAKRVAGAGERDVRMQAAAALRMVGMEEKYGRLPGQLSAGERQKAAVARAIAGSPCLLVVDEPTSGLDPRSTDEIMGLLKRINAALGTTMLIATNDARLVRRGGCRVLLLADGAVRAAAGAGRDYATENRDRSAERQSGPSAGYFVP